VYLDYMTDAISRIVKILNTYKSNETEHKIALNMIRNLDAIPHCSLTEVADMCYCSTATVSRFVKKLNFENFSVFKYKLSSDLYNRPTINRKMQAEHRIADDDLLRVYLEQAKEKIDRLAQVVTTDQLSKIAGLIREAGQVVLYSLGDLSFNSFQVDLAIAGKASYQVRAYAEMEAALPTFSKDTLVIAPLFGTQKAYDLIRACHQKGIRVVTLSRDDNVIFEGVSDVYIHAPCGSTNLDDYMIYLFMDALAIYYKRKHGDEKEQVK